MEAQSEISAAAEALLKKRALSGDEKALDCLIALAVNRTTIGVIAAVRDVVRQEMERRP